MTDEAAGKLIPKRLTTVGWRSMHQNRLRCRREGKGVVPSEPVHVM
jgi:hypothetical protein